jgi:GntR family carbon starvation induced transcriptional regulator
MLHTSPPYAVRQETEVAEPKTLVEAAYRSLRRNIIEGRLSPGEKLRIEHIKNDYGVGGATLREALSLLTSDALVVSQGQRGFRVAPVSLEDLADITETRVMLECSALRQSITLGDEAWEAELTAAFHRLTARGREGSPKATIASSGKSATASSTRS